MLFWVLVFSFWLHLLATVVWLGGLALIVLLALPAWRRGSLTTNKWLDWQRRFVPWVNASLLVLLITGLVQMTNDANYEGFLVLEGVWAWAMLLKHIAYGLMVAISLYLQLVLYPAVERTVLLAGKQPAPAEAERARWDRRASLLLRLNLAAAGAVLLFTAIATAV